MQTPLTDLASSIRDWQQARNLSDAELCKRYSGLGSTKTFKRILDGDLAELDSERWLLEYQQVWTLMEIVAASGEADEPEYDDLAHVTRARLAVTDALQERGNNRLVIIEGPSGAGKSTAGRLLAARFGRRIVLAEADETWKESLASMMGGLLRALGAKQFPPSADGRRQKLIDTLKESPLCLVIDEAHHLGPRTLNLVKTIINQTRSQVVFLAIGTLFKRLESGAYEEARQLTKNRMCERVRLEGPPVDDVEKFLRRRLTWNGDTKLPRKCATVLAERSTQYGNWNLVNLVARKARALSGKDAMDEETFARAIQGAIATR